MKYLQANKDNLNQISNLFYNRDLKAIKTQLKPALNKQLNDQLEVKMNRSIHRQLYLIMLWELNKKTKEQKEQEAKIALKLKEDDDKRWDEIFERVRKNDPMFNPQSKYFLGNISSWIR